MELQKKDKIQIAITACLVVVLIVIMAKSFGGMKGGKSRGKKAPAPAAKTVAAKMAPVKAAALPRVPYEKLAAETKRLELKRDPFFRQVVGSASTVDEPYLSGIVWDSAFPSAIINGKIVGVGEEIVGHIVTDIQKNRVILYNRDTGVEVRLDIE